MSNLKDRLVEFSNPVVAYDYLCKAVGLSSAGAMLLMCIADIYVHPTLGASVPRNRRLLKNYLDNFMLGSDARDIVSHIGNSFLSAAPAIAIVMVGEVCRFVGDKHDNKYLKYFANLAPFIALATVGGLNVNEELHQAQFDPAESEGDLKYGFMAGVMGVIAAYRARIPEVLDQLTAIPLRSQSSPAHSPSGRSLYSANC